MFWTMLLRFTCRSGGRTHAEVNRRSIVQNIHGTEVHRKTARIGNGGSGPRDLVHSVTIQRDREINSIETVGKIPVVRAGYTSGLLPSDLDTCITQRADLELKVIPDHPGIDTK